MKNFSPSLCQDKPFLSLASLFDGSFCLDWLIELTGCKASQVLSILDEGIQQGWLMRQNKGFFAFKNSEVREACKKYLSPEEEQRMHQNIAGLLLKEFIDQDKNAKTIACHLLHVQNDLNGCRLLLKAAEAEHGSYSYSKALDYYKKVISDLSEIGGKEADLLFIEAAIKYSRVSVAREDSDTVSVIIQKAIKRAMRYEMYMESAFLKMHLAKNDFLQLKDRTALKHFEEGWVATHSISDPKYLLVVNAFRIFFHYYKGCLRDVVHAYEESASAMEEFPQDGYPVQTSVVVGVCYVRSGCFTQGLGMLNSVMKNCLEKGKYFLAGDAKIGIAALMIDLRRPDEALSYLEDYKTVSAESDWNQIRAQVTLSYAYHLKGQQKDAVRHFDNWVKLGRKIKVPIVLNGFWFEMCKAMEEDKLPKMWGILLEDEVNKFLKGENIMMRGVAYRYKAFLQQREGQRPAEIIKSFKLSSHWLEKSGHIYELCRTYLDLIRQYTLMGEEEAARELRLNISKTFGPFSQDFVPDDMKEYIKKMQRDQESLFQEILGLNQEISTTRDKRQIPQLIISKANQIAGAERGAIFKIEKNGDSPGIQLKASKNITSAQVSLPSFKPVLEMIEEVAVSGKGKIKKINSNDSPSNPLNERILSQICVPMVIRNTVIGALYQDNSLFATSIEETDLQYLNYFATQAAMALESIETPENIEYLNDEADRKGQSFKEQSFSESGYDDIVGRSKGMRIVLDKIEQVAGAETTVLILGETGVGKDLVARALHRRSNRNNQPFVKVLCNALPESLISSELFGHEKGAFTGSVQRRIGRFEMANGGTIFLDEIGDIQLDIQDTPPTGFAKQGV